jgi:hypothetical protein
MHSYNLVPEVGSKAPWLVEWDDERLVLQDPDGQTVIEADIRLAHRIIDFSRAFVDGTICFTAPEGSLGFKKNWAAFDELRKLVDAGLRSDPEYRAAMRRRALRAMPAGVAMFLVAGALFACYCWYASVAPDPPPNSWLRALAWPITMSSALLLAIALLGVGLGSYGLSQWWHIRRIDRAAAADNPPLDQPGAQDYSCE